MTQKEFLNKIARGKDDFLQRFLDIIDSTRQQTPEGPGGYYALGGI